MEQREWPELTEAEIIAQMQRGERNEAGALCLPADARLLAQVPSDDAVVAQMIECQGDVDGVFYLPANADLLSRVPVEIEEEVDVFERKIGEINDFLCGEKIVCPYARGQVLQQMIEYGRLNGPGDTSGIVEALEEFVAGEKRNLIYVFEGNTADHDQASEWAHQVFVTISRYLAIKKGLSLEEFPRGLFDPQSFVMDGHHFFVFAMSPHYREEHPRWAPHFMVGVNYHLDIDGVDLKIKREILKNEFRGVAKSVHPAVDDAFLAHNLQFSDRNDPQNPMEIDFSAAVPFVMPGLLNAMQAYTKSLYVKDVRLDN